MAREVGPRYSDRVSTADRAATNAVDPTSVFLTVVVYTAAGATDNREAVGHAALRWNGDDLELKRMFVTVEHRGTGVSTALLSAVEDAARKAGRPRLILQTGDRQPDAVRLYEKSGYSRIPIFSHTRSCPSRIASRRCSIKGDGSPHVTRQARSGRRRRRPTPRLARPRTRRPVPGAPRFVAPPPTTLR